MKVFFEGCILGDEVIIEIITAVGSRQFADTKRSNAYGFVS